MAKTSTTPTPKKDTSIRELQQAKFLAKYAETGNVSASARAIKVNRDTVYGWRATNPAFADAMHAAKLQAIEELEGEAFTRAKAHSDVLLIFLLKNLKPEIYGDKMKITQWQDQAIADIKAGRLTFEALAQTFDPDLATQLFTAAGVLVASA